MKGYEATEAGGDLNVIVDGDEEGVVEDQEEVHATRYIAIRPSGIRKNNSDILVMYHAAKPELFVHDEIIHYADGDRLTLTCRAGSVPSPTISWQFNEAVIAPGQKNGQEITIEGDTFESWLTINPASASNAGKYQCTATNSAGESKATTTTILRAASKADGIYTQPETPIVGQPFTLICHVSSSARPKRKWKFEDRTVLSDSKYTIDEKHGWLRIRSVKENMAGKWTCEVSADGGSQKLTKIVNVESRPSFLDGKASAETLMDLGEEARIVCPVTGKPTPRIRWRKRMSREEEIQTNSGHIFIHGDTLAIRAGHRQVPLGSLDSELANAEQSPHIQYLKFPSRRRRNIRVPRHEQTRQRGAQDTR
ncbi:unnamed protein product [Calicophoron daubneyi]|uniref:Ig-like domain-containing protein n=1 Tax=Calicophoron daubneyi TaxID=300641 RepID=A0AAV2TUN0_CALDB